MEEVYLNQPARYKNKKQAWKSDVKLNGLHNIKKAMKSMLWREVYPSADAMFNVRGTNEETEKICGFVSLLMWGFGLRLKDFHG